MRQCPGSSGCWSRPASCSSSTGSRCRTRSRRGASRSGSTTRAALEALADGPRVAQATTSTSRARRTRCSCTPTPGLAVVHVEADDKRRARLNCIAHLLSRIPYKAGRPAARAPAPAGGRGLRAAGPLDVALRARSRGRARLIPAIPRRPQVLGSPGRVIRARRLPMTMRVRSLALWATRAPFQALQAPAPVPAPGMRRGGDRAPGPTDLVKDVLARALIAADINPGFSTLTSIRTVAAGLIPDDALALEALLVRRERSSRGRQSASTTSRSTSPSSAIPMPPCASSRPPSGERARPDLA